MGNRAVITTRENYENDGVGVYIHWNGGRDSVEPFLKYCEEKGYRAPDEDCYGYARLVQVIANFFGGSTSIGVDRVSRLDCEGDNGVYIIEGWKIVDRVNYDGAEQTGHDFNEMMQAIDEAQPVKEQLGGYLTAKIVNRKDIRVGDRVYIRDWKGDVSEVEVKGRGTNRIVNGTNVKGMPFAHIVSTSRDNLNNYIRSEQIRKVG